jgi:hypothetical protein
VARTGHLIWSVSRQQRLVNVDTLLNSLITSVTGVDANALAAEAEGYEQYAILAAEVFGLALLVIIVELGLILFEVRK